MRGYKIEEDGVYRDFWQFLVSKFQIHRSCYFTLSSETGDGAEDWQRILLGFFLAEFGPVIYIWTDW